MTQALSGSVCQLRFICLRPSQPRLQLGRSAFRLPLCLLCCLTALLSLMQPCLSHRQLATDVRLQRLSP